MRSSFVLLCCAALAACAESSTAPGTDVLARDLPLPEGTINRGPLAGVRSVASLVPDGDSLLLHVPARVRRGDTLRVEATIGTGGCTGSDTVVVRVRGLTATVVPYVASPSERAQIACAAIFIPVRFTAPIVFTQAGAAQVQFLVRDGSPSALRRVERRVTVE